MPLSAKLLLALVSWPIQEVPATLFHGCRSEDPGVDVALGKLSGNKWFSPDAGYAGEYAWNFRETGAPLRSAAQVRQPLQAVLCPKPLRGRFNWFLDECFPGVKGYQRCLKSLVLQGGDVKAQRFKQVEFVARCIDE